MVAIRSAGAFSRWEAAQFLGFSQDEPTSVYCNNVGSSILTRDATFHARTKHIDIQHHYVRERVEGKYIHFPYISTRENPPDAFTKSLPRPRLK
jgi:hypothetical protein